MLNKDRLLKRLVKMADDFDRVDNYRHAELVDQIINIVAAQEDKLMEIDVPEDEMEILRELLESFKKSME